MRGSHSMGGTSGARPSFRRRAVEEPASALLVTSRRAPRPTPRSRLAGCVRAGHQRGERGSFCNPDPFTI